MNKTNRFHLARVCTVIMHRGSQNMITTSVTCYSPAWLMTYYFVVTMFWHHLCIIMQSTQAQPIDRPTLCSGFSSFVVAIFCCCADVWATLPRKHGGRIVDRIQRVSVFSKEWLSSCSVRHGMPRNPYGRKFDIKVNRIAPLKNWVQGFSERKR